MNREKENFSHEDADMEDRLWSYLDGQSDEASKIEELLEESNVWKEKYGELLELHTLMKETELEQPSLRFTKNVMDEIARYQIAPATKAYINQKIVWGIGAFFITMIVGFLVYGVSQINWSEAGNTESPIGVDLGAVDYSRMFNNTLVNAFMMLNVVLGLFLLDRYLNMKRKTLMKPEGQS